MPNQPKTPVRTCRIPDDEWSRLGKIAKDQGKSRGEIMRDLVHWYLNGGEPPRPQHPEA